jgi:serine protease AprX
MKREMLAYLMGLGVVVTCGNIALADPFITSLTVGSQPLLPSAGAADVYTITITKTNTGGLDAYLSCDGLPAGATGSFSPNPAVFKSGDSTATATLTIVTTPSVPDGAYPLTITARDGGSHNTVSGSANLAVPGFAATPPPVSLAVMADSSVQVSAKGAPGNSYVLQATPTLAPPAWTNLRTNSTDAAGLFVFTDRDAKTYTTRFYRLVKPQ